MRPPSPPPAGHLAERGVLVAERQTDGEEALRGEERDEPDGHVHAHVHQHLENRAE